VRDSRGVKMSKSLGNGIDPLFITNQFGADALRFTIVFLSGQGKDPKISEKSFELGRNFANKIWNATRFIMMDSDEKVPEKAIPEDEFDRWILTLLSYTEKNFNKAIRQYRLSDGAQIIYEFFWKELCDWYLEIVKSKGKKKGISLFVLKRVMSLLNPYMPYITEEMNEILHSKYPIHKIKYEEASFEERDSLEKVENLKSLIIALRSISQETNSKRISIICENKFEEEIKNNNELILKLSKIENLDLIKEKPKKAVAISFSKGIVYVNRELMENIEEKIEKYEKDLLQIKNEIEKTKRNLTNEKFMKKADKSVIEIMKNKVVEFSSKSNRIEEILKSLKE